MNQICSCESDLRKAINATDPEDARFETEYFRVKTLRNGNLHLEFRRMDLVAKLNENLGGRT
ncbi:MAG TPA: DUF4942 domain-containing protein [Polyangiaceae bacterium]|nr:DUF4942 domain-containing protein [Polyangiaceae bacterium]